MSSGRPLPEADIAPDRSAENTATRVLPATESEHLKDDRRAEPAEYTPITAFTPLADDTARAAQKPCI